MEKTTKSVEILGAELKAELLKLDGAYSQLGKDFEGFMNDDKLYWNGALASSFFKSCIGYFDFGSKLDKDLEKYNKYVQTMIK